LENLDSGDDADLGAVVEAKQRDRPAPIVAILKRISSQYPADIGTTLELYIYDLETKQQIVSQEDDKTPSFDPENPPVVWSHKRAMQREQHRQERAVKKWKMQNNYQ
jgi:hypothetical protein